MQNVKNVQVPADHLEGSGHQHLVAPLAVQGDGPVVDHLTVTTTTKSLPPSLLLFSQVHPETHPPVGPSSSAVLAAPSAPPG